MEWVYREVIMNKDISSENLITFLQENECTISGNLEGWNFVKKDMSKLIPETFNSIADMKRWADKIAKQAEERRLDAEGLTQAGGLQRDMFAD